MQLLETERGNYIKFTRNPTYIQYTSRKEYFINYKNIDNLQVRFYSGFTVIILIWKNLAKQQISVPNIKVAYFNHIHYFFITLDTRTCEHYSAKKSFLLKNSFLQCGQKENELF